jgi:ABC-type molybdenum transport system ATPase subunit/photorepair protein PhrA
VRRDSRQNGSGKSTLARLLRAVAARRRQRPVFGHDVFTEQRASSGS